jgi:hypothetical protein
LYYRTDGELALCVKADSGDYRFLSVSVSGNPRKRNNSQYYNVAPCRNVCIWLLVLLYPLHEALLSCSSLYTRTHTHTHTQYIYTHNCLCGLEVRVPGYTTEMYCTSCEVRTEFIYVMQKKVDRLCGLVVRVPGYAMEMYCVSCEV